MDEHEGVARPRGGPGSALHVVHGAGLLTVIALLVAGCGFGLLAFLGDPQAVAAGPVTGGQVAAVPASALPAPALPAPDPDQQAAFLEAVRLSGTAGWSSRLDVLGHGVRACRLLADGRVAADVVGALVAAGEQPAQARVVTAVATRTLCPSAAS